MTKNVRMDPANDIIDLALFLLKVLRVLCLIFLVAVPVGAIALVWYLVSN